MAMMSLSNEPSDTTPELDEEGPFDAGNFICEDVSDDRNKFLRQELKTKLLVTSATVDRGFGATPQSRARLEVEELVSKLEGLSPIADATRGLVGSGSEFDADSCPLAGTWKLVFTTAYDVLSLNANPVLTLEGIFQDITPSGISRNIIDLVPRVQVLFPFVPPTTFRAVVRTEARARSPARVGLTFKAAEIGPLEILGKEATELPRIGGNFPDISVFGANIGASSGATADGPGYFDVLYLDHDMLIIRQNEPGGIFVSTRVTRDENRIEEINV